MQRLKYKGNTFIKIINGKLLIRVTKKEYLFENLDFEYDIFLELMTFFKKSNTFEEFIKQSKRDNDETIIKKHLYILMKIGSIITVENEFIDSDENDYLLRNYADYMSLIDCKQPNIHYVDGISFDYIGQGIYLTTYLEENLIAHISNQEEWCRFLTEIENKRRRNNVSQNIIKLLTYYGKLLNWDIHSNHRKYKNFFVLTKQLEIINYEPFKIDENEFADAAISEVVSPEKYQITSSILNYLIQHPSFFLQYDIDQNKDGYNGTYFFRGYSYKKAAISGSTYLETTSNMLTELIKTHPLFMAHGFQMMKGLYDGGLVVKYHSYLYKAAGINVS